MKTGRYGVALVAIVLAAALLAPTAAMANGWILERGMLGGFFIFTEWTRPDISGNNAVYQSRATFPTTGKWSLNRFDLRTGITSTVATSATWDVDECAISGDWMVWQVGADIHAKNLKTGVKKNVTNDGLTTLELAPAISGTYVVWSAYNGSNWDVKGKNLASTSPPFTIASGAGDQSQPSIHGKRVAYRDAVILSAGQIKVKTIGSSSSAKMITNNLVDQNSPSIGDHLVAWRVKNTDGFWMIKYYNYDTGGTSNGPSDSTVDMQNPQVSGDRILYDYYTGAGTLKDMFVWDVRAARSFAAPLAMPNTGGDEIWGKISGNSAVYLSNGAPYWAKLAVPSLSVGSVPRRIAHGARIRLKGTLSDQGVPIGKANLRVERYSSGKWIKVTTIKTTSSGTYSYYTPKNYSKRQYRVAYDGNIGFIFSPGTATHFSKVSSVRTAWPR